LGLGLALGLKLGFWFDIGRGPGFTFCWGLIRVVRLLGPGRIAVVGILVDGVSDGLAPDVGAEGTDVFVLRETDGLDEGWAR
jgi:hypothetical protein